MTNLVKKALSTLLDKISSPAQVLAVRIWKPGSMYELDLYLPTVDMAKWTTIPRLKCRVDNEKMEFRDYTPAIWDVAHRTCTLYIEAGHQGAGSSWIKRLCPGDSIFVAHAHAEKLPVVQGRVLALGDGSALGHLLAFKQLTSRLEHPLDACVALHNNYKIPLGLREDNPDIDFCPTTDVHATLTQWLQTRPLSSYTSVYLAGNIKLVAGLRRQLKAQSELQARLYVTGFWK
jgi:NADPH-dependent ferric siderophore reductase